MKIDARTLRPGFALLALVLGSCALTQPTRSDLPAGPVPDAGMSPPLLYARDGSVVSSNGAGSTTQQPGPASDVAPQEGSRMYLLELYQKAIDDKEAMTLEVKSLDATLEKSRGELAAAQKERAELQKRFDALETERARLQEENFDLAGRLVTAQIRRLEAEKILLESKIEWQRLEEKTSAADKSKPAAAAAKTEGARENGDKRNEGHKP